MHIITDNYDSGHTKKASLAEALWGNTGVPSSEASMLDFNKIADIFQKAMTYGGTIFNFATSIGFSYQNTIDLHDLIHYTGNREITTFVNCSTANVNNVTGFPENFTGGFNLFIFSNFVGTNGFTIITSVNGDTYYTHKNFRRWRTFKNIEITNLAKYISSINNNNININFEVGSLSTTIGSNFSKDYSSDLRMTSDLCEFNDYITIYCDYTKYSYRIHIYDSNNKMTQLIQPVSNLTKIYTIDPNTKFALVAQGYPNSETRVNNYNIIDINNYIKIYKGNGLSKDNITFNNLMVDIDNINWSNGTFGPQTIGSKPANSDNNIRKRCDMMHSNIELSLESDGTYKSALFLFDSDGYLISFTGYDVETKIIPKNSYFRIILQDAQSSETDISSHTDSSINQHITIKNHNIDRVINPSSYTPESSESSLKWIVMGDSIAEAYYSYFDTNGNAKSATNSQIAWPRLVADKMGWLMTNVAIGGTGYMHIRTQDTEDMRGCNVAKAQDFTQYDLVTLSYGINDWKGNNPLGSYTDNIQGITTPTTVMQAMKMTIEEIMRQNPFIKIIVTTPFYCHGYNNAYDNTDDYALNYEYQNSGTLNGFVEEMIKVCEYYHIEYIDSTHYGPINRLNVIQACPDGIHPSIETHRLIAQEMCKKINAY